MREHFTLIRMVKKKKKKKIRRMEMREVECWQNCAERQEGVERGAQVPARRGARTPALALSWFPYLGNRDVVYTIGVL